MIAKRIPTILPELSFEETLEVTKIHSISGMLDKTNPIIIQRPFRSPHHNITKIALIRWRKKSKTWRNKFSTFRCIIFRRIT